MGNKDGNHEKYTWKINETVYVHDYIDNIGTADWKGSAKKIKVPFYLSKGTKEDSHSEWVRITSVEYPYVYDVSDEFLIDHAKECK